MMSSNKDSQEVVKFLSLYEKLLNWSDDDPEGLFALALNDKSINAVCSELFWVCVKLKENELLHRQLFASPTDPRFIHKWRDFERRYERVLSAVQFAELVGELDRAAPIKSTDAVEHWDFADDEAKGQANAIEFAISYARDAAEDELREFDVNFRWDIEDGTNAWKSLKVAVGFDLRGVFRRRALIPFVLVPRHVAVGSGTQSAAAMLRNLQQAHDSFIFGAPLAALALMRSIMEAVLSHNYGATGDDLSARIDGVRSRLPESASAAALHRLRKLANRVLHHGEPEKAMLHLDDAQLEREIVSLLHVLRDLIERAPKVSAH